jgi:hypothetical protein
LAVTNIGGLFDDFIELARTRWQAGVDTYRDGDESKPFEGDPLVEMTEEATDTFAYSKEGLKQGMLSDTESDMINVHAYEIYKIVRHVQVSREKAAKAATESLQGSTSEAAVAAETTTE